VWVKFIPLVFGILQTNDASTNPSSTAHPHIPLIAQVAYLNKVISAVAAVTGPLGVKPLKIVAGLEPEQTNAFLTALAKAASGGGAAAPPAAAKPPPAAAAPPPAKPPPAAAPEPKSVPPPPAEAPKQERPKPKPAEEPAAEQPPAAADGDDGRPQRSRGSRKPPVAPTDGEEPAGRPEPMRTPSSASGGGGDPPSRRQSAKEQPPPPAAAEPSAAAGGGGDDGGDGGMGRRMERPRTARRAPPKVPCRGGENVTRDALLLLSLSVDITSDAYLLSSKDATRDV
jgi:TRAF3-interacting protein 1